MGETRCLILEKYPVNTASVYVQYHRDDVGKSFIPTDFIMSGYEDIYAFGE